VFIVKSSYDDGYVGVRRALSTRVDGKPWEYFCESGRHEMFSFSENKKTATENFPWRFDDETSDAGA
jgi:hypothetical protein